MSGDCFIVARGNVVCRKSERLPGENVPANQIKRFTRYKLEWAQMMLFSEIAKKQGVDEALIIEMVTNAQK